MGVCTQTGLGAQGPGSLRGRGRGSSEGKWVSGGEGGEWDSRVAVVPVLWDQSSRPRPDTHLLRAPRALISHVAHDRTRFGGSSQG